MLPSNKQLIICLFILASGLLLSVSFAADDDQKPLDLPTLNPVEIEPVEKIDPFTVPDGTPAELYEYIKGLNNATPEKRDQLSVIAFIKKLGHARMEACEKILASGASLEEKRPAAAMLLSTAAQMALRLGDQDAAKTLSGLPKRLEQLNMPKIAKAAMVPVLQVNLMMSLREMPGAPPLGTVLADLKKYIAKNPDVQTLQMLLSTVSGISQAGKNAAAIDLCNWAVKTFENDKDKNVQLVLGMIEGTARRLELLGKTMVVKGPLLDGKPYNLSDENGKVVLVQFWATWCAPCLEEIENVSRYYKLYHDRGFNVIGISIDQDKSQLEAFLKDKPLPWPVMLDSEAKQSNASRYGVMGIPVLILVDRQGKVVSLNARGPVLGKELEKLLGSPDEKAQANASQQ